MSDFHYLRHILIHQADYLAVAGSILIAVSSALDDRPSFDVNLHCLYPLSILISGTQYQAARVLLHIEVFVSIHAVVHPLTFLVELLHVSQYVTEYPAIIKGETNKSTSRSLIVLLLLGYLLPLFIKSFLFLSFLLLLDQPVMLFFRSAGQR